MNRYLSPPLLILCLLCVPAFAADSSPQTLGGIVPHHDLAMPMIERFYKELARKTADPREVKRVWLFSPDHFRQVRQTAAVSDADWSTPTRILQADTSICELLAKIQGVKTRPDLFTREHGITLHIPLIARTFPNAMIVPLLLNAKTTDIELLILKNRLKELVGEGDLILLSMDLSHYKTAEGMAAEDARTVPRLLALRPHPTADLDIDAPRATTLVLMLFRELGGVQGRLLERRDSSYFLKRRVESGTSYATLLYETGEPASYKQRR